VSKRHSTNRRKSYGRRQHELHERQQRDHQPEPDDLKQDDPGTGGIADRFAFFDPRSSRLRYALGD